MQILCLFEYFHVLKSAKTKSYFNQKLRQIDAHRSILITFFKILMVKHFGFEIIERFPEGLKKMKQQRLIYLFLSFLIFIHTSSIFFRISFGNIFKLFFDSFCL